MKRIAFILSLLCCLGAGAQEARLMLPVGHTGTLKSAVFSPDSKRVLTTSADGTSKVWDAENGVVVLDLEGPVGSVYSALFSPDGKRILTASMEGIQIWSAESGAQLLRLKGKIGETNSGVFSPDGKRILTELANGAAVWSAESGVMLLNLKGHTDEVNSAIFSADGKRIVTASSDGTAKLWDAESGVLLHTFKGSKSEVYSAVFSPDGKRILTISSDSIAKVWSANNGAQLLKLKGRYKFVSTPPVFSPDGKSILAATWGDSAVMCNAENGTLMLTLKDSVGWVESAIFSSDGKRILTTFMSGGIKVWGPGSRAFLLDLKGHDEKVWSAVFSPNGKKIVTASGDGTAKVWSSENGTQLLDLKGRAKKVESTAFSPEGKQMVTTSSDGLKVWSSESGMLLLNLEGNVGGDYSAVFSSDGKRIVTISADSIAKVWSAENGTLLLDLKGHKQKVRSAVFAPDGRRIVTASWDSTVKVWNAESGALLLDLKDSTSPVYSAGFAPDGKRILETLDNGTAKLLSGDSGMLLLNLDATIGRAQHIVFSPDGKLLVVKIFGTDSAKVWDSENGAPVIDLVGIRDWVYYADVSPDGRKIVMCSNNGVAKVWSLESGVLLLDLEGHTDVVRSALFSPDGNRILTASSDGTAKVWSAENGRLLFDLKYNAGPVYSAFFSPDGQRIVISGESAAQVWDASTGILLRSFAGKFGNINWASGRLLLFSNYKIVLADLNTGNMLFTWVSIDSADWVVLHPSGLFDATPGAMDKMYWVKGDEVIAFNQLKDRYWQPGLWQKIMKGEPLRNVEGMGQIRLQPEVELGAVKNGILPIGLKKREGGYGKVSVFVNGKEVALDARPRGFDTSQVAQQIPFNLEAFLLPGQSNTVSVKTWSADGFVASRGIEIQVQGAGVKKAESRPAFYAIVCGTGEFANPAIRLKYPVADAQAVAKAIEIGAANLFGRDSVQVQLLTAPGAQPTTKENIRAAFAAVRARAKQEDVVLVYLSGHGISYGGDNGEFYYLSTDASASSSESFADPVLREKQLVSTSEMTTWLNEIKALKQVMILDACGSGKAVDNLLAKRDIDPSQIRALDRMKDRTGLYVISGCAADAVSFEASRYGQGLLTYAVLQAMKGARLKENKYVDVSELLEYARDEVPKMAQGIGGIQKPQLLVPKGGSFDLGIIREEDKKHIPLASLKPVFVRANLMEQNKMRDVLRLGAALNERLNEVAAKGAGSPIVFVDADDYPDACSISGGYTIKDEKIYFTGSILCGANERPLKLEGLTKEEFVRRVLR